jgi:hypothetical protein
VVSRLDLAAPFKLYLPAPNPRNLGEHCMPYVATPLGWCVFFLAAAAAGAAEPQGRFDGIWATSIACAPAAGALPYRYEFESTVKNGVLHGEHGIKDTPGWLELDGRILPDGTALLAAHGLVGKERAAIGERPRGTPYHYRIETKFSDNAATGHRTEGRVCTLSSSRKAPSGTAGVDSTH